MKQLGKYSFLVIGIFLLFTGMVWYVPEFVTVSNNVYGKELPIQSAETEEKKAALTFECAWGHGNLDKILEILRRYDVRAAFFVTGNWAETYPQELQKIVQGGHDIGNHSMTHRNLKQLEEAEIKEEVMEAHQILTELAEKEIKFFRPPYGAFDDTILLTAKKVGYLTVMGSIDSMDWKDYGTEEIIKTVMENKELQPGAIIRLNSEAKYTKDALPGLIEKLQEEGYRIVPLSNLLYKDEYHLDVKGRQFPDEN